MIQHCSGFPHTKLLCLQHGDFKRSTLGEGEKGERKEGEREGERDGWRGEGGREGGREGRRERGIGGEGRQRGKERGMNGEGGREGWMERDGWRMKQLNLLRGILKAGLPGSLAHCTLV